MFEDYLKISLKNMKQRRIRTWLTMIGIFIGIAAVVSLVSLGQGLQVSIEEQFQLMGIDKILIYPGGGFFGIGGATSLTTSDLEVVEKVRGVDVGTGLISKIAKIEYKDEVKYSWIAGFPTDEGLKLFESIQSFKIEKGRNLESRDKYDAVVGIRFAEKDFFDNAVSVGDNIKIDDYKFKVVGTASRIGNPQDDSQIYIPLDTARIIFDEPEDLTFIMAQVEKGFEPSDVGEAIEKKLRKARDLEEGEEDFVVQTSEQLLETYSTVFGIVNAVVIGLAMISLFVGGIGIMNTMYTAVLQRTNEIGVMKAIGARNKDIMLFFLIESGLLGLAGGVIGVAIGYGISRLITIGAEQAGYAIIYSVFPWYLIVGALLFSFVVGTLSGLLPAIRAAKLQPVEALRYE